ncbi:AAA family ATPase [Haloferax sp. DFSO60]|uniref:AAA family ATPase n=1 Tax=Haloferax sp. DFSO60 TaxID=3388652 RepID=UPI003979ADD2
MPSQTVKDWLAYFEKIADSIGVYVEINSTEIFHFTYDGDPPVIAKVHHSVYPRKENHIWVRFDQEQSRVDQDTGERVFAIQLDVNSKDEFNLSTDHFIVVTEDLIRTELTPNGDVHIDTDKPGQYDAPFNGFVDNWNALFEYITGEQYEFNVSDILDDVDGNIESTTEPAPYYWVTHNFEEFDKGFLSAPNDSQPSHDLAKLQEGDIVFNYIDGAVRGFSVVSKSAYIVDEGTSLNVDIDVYPFDEPLEMADIFKSLYRPEVRLDKYYPFNKSGINPRYLFNMSQAGGDYILHQSGAVREYYELLENHVEPVLGAFLKQPSFDIEFPEELYYPGGDEARLRREIQAALNAGKHLILTGPPGTGKSKIASSIAEQSSEQSDLIGDHIFTTATDSWTTFDTIGGYVPSRENTANALEFDPRLFLSCFRDPTNDTIRNRWLVIDEMNRANIDNAFGQLFSVLAGDSVQLPFERDEPVQIEWVDSNSSGEQIASIVQSRDRYPVTPSWRLLATMNTKDKSSLYDLSFAFMRRFAFVHVPVPELYDGEVVDVTLLDPSGMTNYSKKWLAEDATEEMRDAFETYHEQVSVLWAVVNNHRELGPAIIFDIFQHLAAYQGGDRDSPLTSAITTYVFPQLEGLRQAKQRELLKELVKPHPIESDGEQTTVSLDIDRTVLERQASDRFNIQNLDLTD